MLVEDALGTPTSRLRGTVNVTRTWSLQRSAPTKKLVTKVAVRTISTREGQVELEATEELTVRELKQRIAHRLHISPRKLMILRWWGAIMDDEKTLDECHVADGGLLELSLKNHTLVSPSPGPSPMALALALALSLALGLALALGLGLGLILTLTLTTRRASWRRSRRCGRCACASPRARWSSSTR